MDCNCLKLGRVLVRPLVISSGLFALSKMMAFGGSAHLWVLMQIIKIPVPIEVIAFVLNISWLKTPPTPPHPSSGGSPIPDFLSGWLGFNLVHQFSGEEVRLVVPNPEFFSRQAQACRPEISKYFRGRYSMLSVITRTVYSWGTEEFA